MKEVVSSSEELLWIWGNDEYNYGLHKLIDTLIKKNVFYTRIRSIGKKETIQ